MPKGLETTEIRTSPVSEGRLGNGTELCTVLHRRASRAAGNPGQRKQARSKEDVDAAVGGEWKGRFS